MNADALPLGFAPHKLVQTSPDGVEQIAGRFLSAELAEASARLLRHVSPQDTFTVTAEPPVLRGLEGKV